MKWKIYNQSASYYDVGYQVEPPKSVLQMMDVGDVCLQKVCRIPRAAPKELKRLILAAPDLLEALQGLGAMPGGYCFCQENRDAMKPEHEHVGECRAARDAIANTK